MYDRVLSRDIYKKPSWNGTTKKCVEKAYYSLLELQGGVTRASQPWCCVQHDVREATGPYPPQLLSAAVNFYTQSEKLLLAKSKRYPHRLSA